MEVFGYRRLIAYQKAKEIVKRTNSEPPAAYKIHHRYHYDTELKRRASMIVKHEFNEDEYTQERVRIVKEIQLCMRTYIANKGIAVESCPGTGDRYLSQS